MGIIVRYCSLRYYIEKLFQFLREVDIFQVSVRFLRGTYEKIVSSAADRPKLVVRGHALTLNCKVSECHFLRFLRETLGK